MRVPSYRIDPAPAIPSELVAELPLVASGIAAAPPSGTKAATPLDLRVLELAEDDAQAKEGARRPQRGEHLQRLFPLRKSAPNETVPNGVFWLALLRLLVRPLVRGRTRGRLGHPVRAVPLLLLD
jgi:hypothetical protein